MGFVLKICLLLLVLEFYALANPVNPQSGESFASKSTNRKLFMMDGEDPPEAPADPAEGGAPPASGTTAAPKGTTAAPGGTTTPANRSSFNVPSVILSVAALMPIFIVNKLREN